MSAPSGAVVASGNTQGQLCLLCMAARLADGSQGLAMGQTADIKGNMLQLRRAMCERCGKDYDKRECVLSHIRKISVADGHSSSLDKLENGFRLESTIWRYYPDMSSDIKYALLYTKPETVSKNAKAEYKATHILFEKEPPWTTSDDINAGLSDTKNQLQGLQFLSEEISRPDGQAFLLGQQPKAYLRLRSKQLPQTQPQILLEIQGKYATMVQKKRTRGEASGSEDQGGRQLQLHESPLNMRQTASKNQNVVSPSIYCQADASPSIEVQAVPVCFLGTDSEVNNLEEDDINALMAESPLPLHQRSERLEERDFGVI